MPLSKLHVRFIQSQKNFSIRHLDGQEEHKRPLFQLYIKDMNTFYLINTHTIWTDKQTLTIRFSEATDALSSLECTVETELIDVNSDAYEEALLFFNIDDTTVKQLFSLHLKAIEENVS